MIEQDFCLFRVDCQVGDVPASLGFDAKFNLGIKSRDPYLARRDERWLPGSLCRGDTPQSPPRSAAPRDKRARYKRAIRLTASASRRTSMAGGLFVRRARFRGT